MKQNDLTQLPKLRRENYENIFDVYRDGNGFYFYNLLQTVSIPSNLPQSLFTVYTATYDDTWPLVSYKSFKTPNLWWLLMLVNNIIDPTNQPQPGDQLKIPVDSVVRAVLDRVNSRE